MEKENNRIDEIREEMGKILGIDAYEGIENEYEHAINYQLDDNEVDRFQELREELKKVQEEEKEKAPKTRIDEIREEMGKILEIDAYEGIENEYEHAINYQLDDNEIDRFQELREELKAEMGKNGIKTGQEPISKNDKDGQDLENDGNKRADSIYEARIADLEKRVSIVERKLESERYVLQNNEGNYTQEDLEKIHNEIELLMKERDSLKDEIANLKKDILYSKGDTKGSADGKAEEEKGDTKGSKKDMSEETQNGDTKDVKGEDTFNPLTVNYKLGFFKKCLLTVLGLVKKISKGKFYDTVEGWEESILASAMVLPAGTAELVKESDEKNVKSKAKPKFKAKAKAKSKETDMPSPFSNKKEEKNPNKSSVTTKEDIIWIRKKLQEMDEKNETIDKDNDVFYKVSTEEFDNLKKEFIGHNAESLSKAVDEKMEKEGLEPIDGIDGKSIIYSDKIAKSIRKTANDRNISLVDENGDNRSIEELMGEIEKKILQEKTNEVSRKASEKQNEGKDTKEASDKTPESEMEEK